MEVGTADRSDAFVLIPTEMADRLSRLDGAVLLLATSMEGTLPVADGTLLTGRLTEVGVTVSFPLLDAVGRMNDSDGGLLATTTVPKGDVLLCGLFPVDEGSLPFPLGAAGLWSSSSI